MDVGFKIGGYNIKGWMVAVALPVLSGVSGGVYFGYDTLNRFFDVEAGVEESLEKAGTLEQSVLEIQRSITQLSNNTDKEITAAKTFAANQLTTARTAIAEEILENTRQLSSKIVELQAELTSRVQTVEQAVVDNDVRGLNTKLAQLTTNMQQILEQQKVLMDLRSQVDKATTITNGIGDKLEVLQTEVDDIWKAYDSLVENPL
jgi:phage shock protein A